MLSPREEQKLRDIIARQEIYDLLCDYMRAQDRLDPALHRSVFYGDATTDYGAAYSGGPDGFVAFAQGVLSPHLANHHMIGQTKIEIEGDIAFGEIYFQAHHRIVEDGEERDLFVSGRYIDRYEKRSGSWKIAHRSEKVDWVRNEPRADGFLQDGDAFPWGARAPDDLSYKRDVLKKL